MHLRLLAFFSVVCASALWSASAQAATLQEALKPALENHPRLSAERATVRATAQSVKQARADLLPTVSAQASAGYEETNTPTTRANNSGQSSGSEKLTSTQTALTASQLVFDGFGELNEMRAAKQDYTAADYTLQSVANDFSLNAIRAWLEVERLRQVVKLSEENVALHQKYLDDMDFALEAGGGKISDVQQTRSRLELAKARYLQSQGELRKAEADYKEIFGDMPTTLTAEELAESTLPPDVNAAVALSRHHPALKAAHAATKAANNRKAATFSPFVPRVDLEVTGNSDNNVSGIKGEARDLSALVVARYDFYTGGADTARRQQEAENALRAADDARRIRGELERDAAQAWADLEVARLRLPVLQSSVENAEKVVASYRDEFGLGRRSLLDLLDSENERLQSRIALAGAETQEQFAEYQVLARVGNLLKVLGLEVSSAE